MSQGIIITLIICGTILVLSLAGMVSITYIIKKGIGFAGKVSGFVEKVLKKEKEN